MGLEMSARVFCILVFTTILISGVLSHPPLQVEPQVAGLQDDFPALVKKTLKSGGSINARLPKSIIPTHYDVDILPLIDDDTAADFKTAPGHVKITVTCVETTNTITLHSVEITIEEQGAIKVTDVTGTDVPVASRSFDPAEQTLIIQLAEGSSLTAGVVYTIDIDFVARVADDRTDGLYLSWFEEPDTGITNYHVATQFEYSDARKAFPCFDEPALRATYKFRIGRVEGPRFHTLWNTELFQTTVNQDRNGYVWDEYDVTPQNMSTYLLAIVVSDFGFDTADEAIYPKPVKTWAPNHLRSTSDGGKFASEAAARILDFFEIYLDHPYEFPKMDSVAVPIFAAGAMENWGLNLYQTYLLLFTEGESTQLEKWNMARVIAHELSHQWWGNLVTMTWWNDLWLNEGFATYMQFVGGDAAVKDFQALERFTIDATQRALEYDATPDTAPVSLLDLENVKSPPTRIVYDKAGSLIRMMNGFLGEDTLLAGLQAYLKEKAYDNAVQKDLFDQLNIRAEADGSLPEGLTVNQIMNTWTLQHGFPLVRVSRASATRVYFTQERFVSDPAIPAQELWYIPVAYTTKAAPVVSLLPKFWINNDVILTAQNANAEEWILVNPNANGFYRVLYDSHFTNLLKGQLAENHEQIPTLSRAQLLDDYFKSAFAGYIGVEEALAFTTYLNKEAELPVWTTAFNNLRKSFTLLTQNDNELAAPLNTYLSGKITDPLAAISPEPAVGESPVTTMLRAQLLDWACAVGNDLCATTALELFAAWIATPATNPIWADYHATLYCAAIAHGTAEAEWDFVISKYQDPTNNDRQRTLLSNALACTADTAKIQSLIEWAADPASIIQETHAVTLLEKLVANQAGRTAVYNFIKADPEAIILNERLGKAAIIRLATTLGNYFQTAAEKEDLQAYLDDNSATPGFDEQVKNSLTTAIATVEANIKWIATYGPDFKAFLDAQEA